MLAATASCNMYRSHKSTSCRFQCRWKNTCSMKHPEPKWCMSTPLFIQLTWAEGAHMQHRFMALICIITSYKYSCWVLYVVSLVWHTNTVTCKFCILILFLSLFGKQSCYVCQLHVEFFIITQVWTSEKCFAVNLSALLWAYSCCITQTKLQ